LLTMPVISLLHPVCYQNWLPCLTQEHQISTLNWNCNKQHEVGQMKVLEAAIYKPKQKNEKNISADLKPAFLL